MWPLSDLSAWLGMHVEQALKYLLSEGVSEEMNGREDGEEGGENSIAPTPVDKVMYHGWSHRATHRWCQDCQELFSVLCFLLDQ